MAWQVLCSWLLRCRRRIITLRGYAERVAPPGRCRIASWPAFHPGARLSLAGCNGPVLARLRHRPMPLVVPAERERAAHQGPLPMNRPIGPHLVVAPAGRD